MGEQFGVKSDELRSISEDLHDVSSLMKGVMSSLRARLGGEGAPWGQDSIRDQFANGAQRHRVELQARPTRAISNFTGGLSKFTPLAAAGRAPAE